MQKHAFKMRLNPGMAEEHRRRHDAIWPELMALLKDAGVSNYSIHLDPETGTLFAVPWRRDDHRMDDMPAHPVMQRSWAHLSNIMAATQTARPS